MVNMIAALFGYFSGAFVSDTGGTFEVILSCCNQGVNVRNIFVSLIKQGFKSNQTSFLSVVQQTLPGISE